MTWNDLDMKSRSDLMELYLKHGITSLDAMKEHYNSFATGGQMNTDDPNDPEEPIKQKPLNFINGNKLAKKGFTYEDRAKGSEQGMLSAWLKRDAFFSADKLTKNELNDALKLAGPMQNSFLLSGSDKDRYMLEHGYIKGKKGDYGLVNKAVKGRDLPVYQTQEDDIERDYLVPIGNIHNNSGWLYSNQNESWFGQPNAVLQHAGSYPTTLYIDGRDPDNVYQKAWDLNDYGSAILNSMGYPAVQTTGYSYVPFNRFVYETLLGRKGPRSYFDDFLKSRNLHSETIDGVKYYFHPEVEITAKRNKD